MSVFSDFYSSRPSACRWMYGATVMVDRLGRVIERGCASEDLIPKGIFLGMERFFRLAINSDNLCESIDSSSAGRVAADALAASSSKPHSLYEFDEVMKQFLEFLYVLNEHQNLSRDDLETAEKMRKFFRQIELAGGQRTMIPL